MDEPTAICLEGGKRTTYDGESIAAVVAHDGNLYMSGSDADGACYWEDGDKGHIDGSKRAGGAALGLDRDGGMVVVGSYAYGSDTRRAWYFTDGEEEVILEEYSARASDVHVLP